MKKFNNEFKVNVVKLVKEEGLKMGMLKAALFRDRYLVFLKFDPELS